MRVLGECEHDPFDVEHADKLGKLVGRAENPPALEPGSLLSRVPVDEAEQVDSVLGVLTELVGHELADVAGPDDDRVLEIRDRATAERAGESTRHS